MHDSRSSRARVIVPAALIVVWTVLAPAAPAHAAGATCRGVRATIVGTPSPEVIRGTAGRDVIAGLGGDDTIVAKGGNDLVCGGYGADRLYGGAGSDRLYGEQDRLHFAQEDGMELIGDTLRGGPGDDRLDGGWDRRSADLVVFDVLSWDESAHGVHIDLRTGAAHGEGADTFAGGPVTIVGSPHGDVVEGTSHRDWIYTGPGPDVVRAGGGPDFVYVDDQQRGSASARDRVRGGDGNDKIYAIHGEDHLDGGAGDDYFDVGGTSNDVLLGGPGDDSFWAEVGDTDGPQRFDGGPGTDGIQVNTDGLNPEGAASAGVWNMATGAMTFTLDQAISLSVSHLERAILASSGTAWSVTGTDEDDFVAGDANGTTPFRFDGLAGDDRFRGTDGDDVFDGGPGDDHSLGMFAGDDTCTSVETVDGSDCEHVT